MKKVKVQKKTMKKFAIPAAAAVAVTAGVVGVAITMEKPLVTVNGTGISPETVEKHLSAIPANLMNGQEALIRQNIIERLIEQELVLQNADESGAKNEAEYKEGLNNVTRNFTYNYMVQKEVADRLSDEKLLEIYNKNKDQFSQPTVKARHILSKTEADAKKIIAKLEKGADFAKLAEKESTGPSAKNGGDLGYFKAQDMVPAFAQAAFALETGTFTKEPVQTQFGYHVILVEDKKTQEAPAFDAMKDALKQQLAQSTAQTYIKELRDAAKIEYTNKTEDVAAAEAEGTASETK